MKGLRLTYRGWFVLTIAGLLAVIGINYALSGKCWNPQGFGYTTCEWAKEGK